MATRPQQSSLGDADSAARRAAVSAIGWLPIAATLGLLVQLVLFLPGASGGVDLLTYGRLRAVADVVTLFGWLSTACFLALFAIVPRVAGVQLHNEGLGRASIGLWNLLLFVGVLTLLFGMNQGRLWGELPVALDVLLAFVMAIVAYNVAVTLARRTERTLYVSAWYLLAAAVFLPLVFIAGNYPLSTGVPDAIVAGFYRQSLQWLWFVAVGIGAAYWIVPTATGNPLHSRALAAIGFWSLILVAGWTGQRDEVWGPTQPYLQTIAIVMSAVLLLPVLTAASNLYATARGRWSRVEGEYGLRFAAVALGFLIAWTALAALSSERSVARIVGLTAWGAGLRHLALWGVFASFAFAILYHLLPRVMGRSWYSRRLCALHFWATVGAVTAGTLVLLAAGLAQGMSALTWATAGDGGAFGRLVQFGVRQQRAYQALALVAFAVLALAQWVFVWNAYRSARRGDPLYLVEESPAVAEARA